MEHTLDSLVWSAEVAPTFCQAQHTGVACPTFERYQLEAAGALAERVIIAVLQSMPEKPGGDAECAKLCKEWKLRVVARVQKVANEMVGTPSGGGAGWGMAGLGRGVGDNFLSR